MTTCGYRAENGMSVIRTCLRVFHQRGDCRLIDVKRRSIDLTRYRVGLEPTPRRPDMTNCEDSFDPFRHGLVRREAWIWHGRSIVCLDFVPARKPGPNSAAQTRSPFAHARRRSRVDHAVPRN